MSIELPLYAQSKRNTCALACLRMVLAGYGQQVEESTLEAEARMEAGGTPLEELERLVRRFTLTAEIQETTIGDLRRILDEGRLPIAYIDRAVFDLPSRRRSKHSIRDAKIHTVIPTRITEGYVTFHDPLPPRIARRSIGIFQHAHQLLGGSCVVCSKPQGVGAG